MEYTICYGSLLAYDGFRFVGKGKIKIHNGIVQITGRQRLSQPVQVAVFLLLTIVSQAILGFGLSYLLALIIVRCLWLPVSTTQFNLADIQRIHRTGKKITFKAPIHPSCQIFRKGVFRATSIENAQAIEEALTLSGHFLTVREAS
ncbi:MAG: hypothetical protein Kow00121_67500 [Elainellaceae cyanobacterium]